MRTGAYVVACALASVPAVSADWPWPWGSPSPSPTSSSAPGPGSAVTTYSTGTQLQCFTLQGLLSPILGIVTQTVTQQVQAPFPTYVQSTSTPIVQITPNPVHVTVSVTNLLTTTIQAPAVTSVFSTTSTLIQSILSTITPPLATSTSTIARTQTTYTSTSTIPASAGFLGVLATGLPVVSRAKREALLNPHGNRGDLEERGGILGGLLGGLLGGGGGTSSNPLNQLLNGLPGLPSLGGLRSIAQTTLYDIQVNCIAQIITHKIIITTVLAPAKTVTLNPLTATSTATTTRVSTSTLAPSSVTVTSSFSTTSTVSGSTTLPQQTFTSTTTTTATLSLPTTFYAACGAQNLLGPVLPSLFGSVAGDVITDIYYDPSQVSLMTIPGNTAYDCCVQCATYTGCAFGGWDPAGICYLHVDSNGVCPAQNTLIGQYTAGPLPQDTQYAVYNGYCGTIQYGGLDSS